MRYLFIWGVMHMRLFLGLPFYRSRVGFSARFFFFFHYGTLYNYMANQCSYSFWVILYYAPACRRRNTVRGELLNFLLPTGDSQYRDR